MKEYHEHNLTAHEATALTALQRAMLMPEERQAMRGVLAQRMLSDERNTQMRGAAWTHFLFAKPAYGAYVFLVLAFVGVGIGKAAEQAVPGDALYKAKTVLYEPLTDVLSSDDAVTRSQERIKERLKEAELLVGQGKFTEKEREVLETLIDAEWQLMMKYNSSLRKEGIIKELEYFSPLIQLRLDQNQHFRLYSFNGGYQEEESSVRVISHDKSIVEEEFEEKEEESDEDDEDEREDEERSHRSQGITTDRENEDEADDKKSTSNSGSGHDEKEEEEDEEDDKGSSHGSSGNDDEEDEEDEEDTEDEEEE